jgi:hypothetical protein
VTILHLLLLEDILSKSLERQVNGETIRYSQDEERVRQTLGKQDSQAAFLLNAPKFISLSPWPGGNGSVLSAGQINISHGDRLLSAVT